MPGHHFEGNPVDEGTTEGYWSELPFPSPGNLPDPGIEPGSPALQAASLLSEPSGKTRNIYLFGCAGS